MTIEKRTKVGSLEAEWKEFCAWHPNSSVRTPRPLREGILASVRADLEPSGSRVLAKLGVVHLLTSFATLSICPQFGVRLFGEGMGIMHYFTAFGEPGCSLACGFFFLGATLLAAALVFSRAEWRQLRSRRFWSLTALVLPSIAFFKLMGGEFPLAFSLAWLVGAFACGLTMLEGVWRIKTLPAHA
jgi:hypothetical protein